uniref:4Fe-4S dicluster domain-containing protein n=1 Tax=Thermofilum pendens TaxID=2269 RepID=A0A7C3SKJ5_THEPE
MKKYVQAIILGVKEAFEGRLTEPLQAVTSNDRGRGVPVLNNEKCLGCGLCARSCPPAAIKMRATGKKVVGGKEVPKQEPFFDYHSCIYCGVCADVCPAKAIRMVRASPLDAVQGALPQLLAVALPPQVTTFLVILFAVALVYWISGKLAPRGSHSQTAREPFSGGIPPTATRLRYHAVDLMTFALFLLLAEALCLLLLLVGSGDLPFGILLATAVVIFLQGLLIIRR